MQLNKQYVDKKTLQKAENAVAYWKKSVGLYQEISRGGKDGITSALVLLKDMCSVRERLRDDMLEKFSLARTGRASVYAAEVRMLRFVITLFEDPKAHMVPFENQLKEAEKELSDLRKIPGRD